MTLYKSKSYNIKSCRNNVLHACDVPHVNLPSDAFSGRYERLHKELGSGQATEQICCEGLVLSIPRFFTSYLNLVHVVILVLC